MPREGVGGGGGGGGGRGGKGEVGGSITETLPIVRNSQFISFEISELGFHLFPCHFPSPRFFSLFHSRGILLKSFSPFHFE